MNSSNGVHSPGAFHHVWATGSPQSTGAHSATVGPASFALTDEGAASLAPLLAFPKDRVCVRSMMNQSLDGSLTGDDGTSGSLGNPSDFFTLTVLRALPDIIVAGAATVREEEYRRPSGRACVRALSLRPGGTEYPALAVLTKSGDIPETLDPEWPTYLVTPHKSRSDVLDRTGFPHERVIAADSPAECVQALSSLGFRGIQVEGGAHVLGDFLAAGVIDQLAWSHSTLTVGGEHSRVTAGPAHHTSWNLRDMFIGPEATLSIYENNADTHKTAHAKEGSS